MTVMMRKRLCLSLLPLLVSTTLAAPPTTMHDASLKIGDLAPLMAPDRWLKGGPIERYEAGRIYVLEFWASWCTPCVAAFPDVKKLEAKHPNVMFVSQSIWEHEPDAVPRFMSEHPACLPAHVAADNVTDGKTGRMFEAWMRAARQSGIPCAFVIGGDGRLAWVGDPRRMEEPLDAIVAGRFDRDAFAKIHRAKQHFNRVLDDRLWPTFETRDWERSMTLTNELEREFPDRSAIFEALRMNIIFKSEDSVFRHRVASEIAARHQDDPSTLDCLAGNILLWGRRSPSELGLAEQLARRAVALSAERDGCAMATLASVRHAQGYGFDAQTWQQKAILVSPAEDRPALETDLHRYMAGSTGSQK